MKPAKLPGVKYPAVFIKTLEIPADEHRHTEVIAKSLGMSYDCAYMYGTFDTLVLSNCKNIPDVLPKGFRRVDSIIVVPSRTLSTRTDTHRLDYLEKMIREQNLFLTSCNVDLVNTAKTDLRQAIDDAINHEEANQGLNNS
jgi:hypothetical protein